MMKRFLGFLAEAFPPKKKPTGPPNGGAKASPFGGKPASGGFPPKQDDAAPPTNGNDSGNDDAGFGASNQAPGDGNAELLGFQQAQQEAELQRQQEAEAERQAKEAAEEAERLHIKKLRLAADAEVAKALEDKYNSDDDSITFYPDMLSFSQFAKDGKPVKEDDEANDEENGTDETSDDRDSDDSRSGRSARKDSDGSDDEDGDENSDEDSDAGDEDEPKVKTPKKDGKKPPFGKKKTQTN